MWTPKLVEGRLKDAALVLRMLPDIDRRFRLGARALWPDCVLAAMESYGYKGDPGLTGMALVRDSNDNCKIIEREVVIPRDVDAGRKRRGRQPVPSARQIDQMEAALPWLRHLRETRLRVTWKRINGTPWLEIAGWENRSTACCRLWYVEALEQISDELITVDRIAEREARSGERGFPWSNHRTLAEAPRGRTRPTNASPRRRV